MKRYLTLVFLMTVLCAPGFAQQKTKITKVLDSNLFETSDGRTVKLAGVDVPKKNHPDRCLKAVAGRAIDYAGSAFLNRSLNIKPLLPKDSAGNYELVIIEKNYPFGELDYNKEYLLLGFGRFTDSVPSAYYNEYQKAEQDARINERGIWKVLSAENKDVLDREFSPEEISRYVQKDSLLLHNINLVKQRSRFGVVAGELVFGPFLGVVTGVSGVYLFGGLSNMNHSHGSLDNLALGVIGFSIGYVTGTALGVYIIARAENPNVSFWPALGYSFLGSVSGLGIAALTGSPAVAYLTIAAPLICSMVYANNVPMPPVTGDDYSLIGKYSSTHTHKDLYNSTVLCNVNLFKIAF